MLKFVRNGKVVMEMKDDGKLKVKDKDLKEKLKEKIEEEKDEK